LAIFSTLPDVPRAGIPVARVLRLGHQNRVFVHRQSLLVCPKGRGEAFADKTNDPRYNLEHHRESDGRWLADIPALPGVTACGQTEEQSTAAVQERALRHMADRLEHGEIPPGTLEVTFISA